MNIDKVDKIVLKDKNDLDTLFKWRDLNKCLVREFKPTLNEGIIVFNAYRQYFKQEGNHVFYRVWFGDHEAMTLTIEKDEKNYRVLNVDSEFKGNQLTEYMQDCVTVHASLMAYMAHYEHHVAQRRELSTKTKKAKRKGGKSSKDRVIKIGRKVYDVTIPTGISTDKRPYERHTKSWEVKGHPRTYKKTGKTIWIESYKKGDKTAEKEPKTYKM